MDVDGRFTSTGRISSVEHEYNVLKPLEGTAGFPRPLWFGRHHTMSWSRISSNCLWIRLSFPRKELLMSPGCSMHSYGRVYPRTLKVLHAVDARLLGLNIHSRKCKSITFFSQLLDISHHFP